MRAVTDIGVAWLFVCLLFWDTILYELFKNAWLAFMECSFHFIICRLRVVDAIAMRAANFKMPNDKFCSFDFVVQEEEDFWHILCAQWHDANGVRLMWLRFFSLDLFSSIFLSGRFRVRIACVKQRQSTPTFPSNDVSEIKSDIVSRASRFPPSFSTSRSSPFVRFDIPNWPRPKESLLEKFIRFNLYRTTMSIKKLGKRRQQTSASKSKREKNKKCASEIKWNQSAERKCDREGQIGRKREAQKY